MSDNELTGSAWTRIAKEVIAAATASKQVGEAGVELQRRYDELEPELRPAVNEELIRQLADLDEQLRFEALSLIRNNRVATAIPALLALAERVESETGPGAKYLLARIDQIVDELKGFSVNQSR